MIICDRYAVAAIKMAAEVDSVDVVTSNKSSGSGSLSSRKGGQYTGRYSNTKNFIAGGVGGVVVVALGHPFDTIKVSPCMHPYPLTLMHHVR